MVATFKGAQRRRRSSVQPPPETELQMPLEDLMFSPYKRRKLQKQKDMQAADLAKLQQAANVQFLPYLVHASRLPSYSTLT
ncbi:hypothetical protein DYB25_012184 [Aphanomyces astaci]|uniref:Uncharacterized protein n=1 Tax=Aphanomyces astaci TaxID=112090 RepID=A0A397A7I1_APHAT|nr:hypothetical protein DYB25_012184 [Aphanomyces astaci]